MQRSEPASSNAHLPRSGAPATSRSRLLLGLSALAVLLVLAVLVVSVWPGTGTWVGSNNTTNNSSATAGAASGEGAVVLAQASSTPVPPTRVPPTPTATLTPYNGDPVSARPAPSLGPGMRYFTETGHLVSGDFYTFYRGSQKSADLFGLPLTEAFAQKLPGGGVYMVQYFERARMELHPDLPASQRLQLGALGAAALEGRTFDRVSPVQSTAARAYFNETGHTIQGGFYEFWRANGGLRLFGLPLTEEIHEDGMTVQYFERARFEYHPEFVGTPYAIQLSTLGYTVLKQAGFNIPMGTLVRFNPPRLAEGHTATVEVAASPGVSLTGQYQGRSLYFTLDEGRGVAWAMLGAVPFNDVGPRQVTISLVNGDGGRRVITRTLEITPYNFPSETLRFDPETAELLDPSYTGPELDTLNRIFSGRTPEKYWDGPFIMPLAGNVRVTSKFATRRCYNCAPGSKPTSYHGGMDIAVNEGTPVRAPAAGKIVFSGKLDVRGNTVIIDHGLGVFTLLAHNSRLLVQEGQMVQQGDRVSLSGNTGLSNGPHLHWEVHASGPPVEPMEWVNRTMP
ncbi:MAG: M23 family metallopeptidase [Chloroflexota bacterium]|nr:M23 family metallopeptidase [Chloroflexota bacterium]MDQ5867235.1 M23 family metallopeptidase [Chloroflexota bacterium]